MSDRLNKRKVSAPKISGMMSQVLGGSKEGATEEERQAALEDYRASGHVTRTRNIALQKSFDEAHPALKKPRKKSSITPMHKGARSPKPAVIKTPAANSIFNVKVSDD